MLYQLLTSVKESFSFLNVFEYITFRSASAAITALVISFIIGPWIIHILQSHQIGEEIRQTGPDSHLKKKGTPTMGGLLILSAVLIPTFLFGDLSNTIGHRNELVDSENQVFNDTENDNMKFLVVDLNKSVKDLKTVI